MSCNDKIRQKCSPKHFAVCTEYQGTIPTFSSLTKGCLDMEEVAEDVYNILGEIKSTLDLTDLAEGCVTFSGPKILQSVLEHLHTKLCALEVTVKAQAITISTQTAQITNLQTKTCP